MGASSPLVRFIVRTNAFFLCPSPELATVNVCLVGSSSSSSTRARLARAMPGPAGGGDFRTDIDGGREGVLGAGRIFLIRRVFIRRGR